MQLSPENQEWFETLEGLFQQPGWKLVVKYFQEQKDNLKDGIFTYSKSDTFFIAKGRAQGYDQITGFEQFCDTLKQHILDTEEVDAESI